LTPSHGVMHRQQMRPKTTAAKFHYGLVADQYLGSEDDTMPNEPSRGVDPSTGLSDRHRYCFQNIPLYAHRLTPSYDEHLLNLDGGPVGKGNALSLDSLHALSSLLAKNIDSATVLQLTIPIPLVDSARWQLSPDSPATDMPVLPDVLHHFQQSLKSRPELQLESLIIGFAPLTRRSYQLGELAAEALGEFCRSVPVKWVGAMLGVTSDGAARLGPAIAQSRVQRLLLEVPGKDLAPVASHITQMLHSARGLKGVALVTSGSAVKAPYSSCEEFVELVEAAHFTNIRVALHDSDFGHCLRFLDSNCHNSKCEWEKEYELQHASSFSRRHLWTEMTRYLPSRVNIYTTDVWGEGELSVATAGTPACALCSHPSTFNLLAAALRPSMHAPWGGLQGFRKGPAQILEQQLKDELWRDPMNYLHREMRERSCNWYTQSFVARCEAGLPCMCEDLCERKVQIHSELLHDSADDGLGGHYCNWSLARCMWAWDNGHRRDTPDSRFWQDFPHQPRHAALPADRQLGFYRHAMFERSNTYTFSGVSWTQFECTVKGKVDALAK